MRNHLILLAGFAALAGATAGGDASANDTSAELATGGLVLTKDADIEMRSEDLYVSDREIRVRYRFFNKAGEDKTVTVAFPMPDLTSSDDDEQISLPTNDTENLLGFATTADGQPVASHVEQKAFARGVDRTELLRSLGIPLLPLSGNPNAAMDALPQEKRDELVRLGLAEINQDDLVNGQGTHLLPRWTLKTTYYWQQRFPAGREIVVEHRYKPSVGGAVGTALVNAGREKEDWYKDYLRNYCIDPAFLAALDRAAKAMPGPYPLIREERIAYVLKTGANWSGPIREFRLVVDKGAPGNLVSFCADGVKAISPTQFEVRRSNYIPASDLDILILMAQPQ